MISFDRISDAKIAEVERTLFRLTLDMLCVADHHGFFVHVNPSWEQALGWSIEEFKAVHYYEFVHPEDLDTTLNAAKRLSKEGYELVTFYNRYKHKNGSYRWILWSCKSDKDFIYAVARDVTDMKEQELLLHQVEETANIGGWRLHSNSNNIQWTNQTYKIHELPAGAPLDMNRLLSFCHDDYREQVQQTFCEAKERAKPFDMVLKLVTAMNREKWARLIGHPAVDKNNEVYEITGVIQDITAQKELELAVENERLRALTVSKLATLGEIAGGIAHEINNPLAIILGRTHQLQKMVEKNECPQAMQKALSSISDTGHRIVQIVHGMKNLLRDSNRDDFVLVDLSRVVHDTVAFSEERVRSLGIDLIKSIADHVIVHGNTSLISQVLLNLTINATYAVSSSKSSDRWIKVECDCDEHGAFIAVTNSGAVISPELRDRIMEPFFTTKPQGEGSGLGLSISSSIMLQHHGKLYLDDESEFTRFVARFPRANEFIDLDNP